jgi:hypothetical protein
MFEFHTGMTAGREAHAQTPRTGLSISFHAYPGLKPGATFIRPLTRAGLARVI